MVRKQEALVKELEEQRVEDLKVQEGQERTILGLLESIKEEEARHGRELGMLESRHANQTNALNMEHAQKLGEEQKRLLSEKDALVKQMKAAHGEEIKKVEEGLSRSQNFINYLGRIMLNSQQKMEEQQLLIETQADTIAEKMDALREYRNNSVAESDFAKTMLLQTETIGLLKETLASSRNMSELSTKDLSQHNLAEFMVELMESYNKQAKVIENLKSVMEKEKEIDNAVSQNLEKALKAMSVMAKGYRNDDATIAQQAKVIKFQGRWINTLAPLLRFNPIPSDQLWFEFEDNSTCSCLPGGSQPHNLTPTGIEYHCENFPNRLFKFLCSKLTHFALSTGLSALPVRKATACLNRCQPAKVRSGRPWR